MDESCPFLLWAKGKEGEEEKEEDKEKSECRR